MTLRTREEFDAAFRVQIELPLQWGEMDAFNHLNNTMYFRYFESARLAYFDRVGVLERMQSEGVGPILAETACRFLRPLHYPDALHVGAAVSEIHSHGFLMQYGVFSSQLQAVAALGNGRVVMLDYHSGGKVKPDQDMIKAIAEIDPLP